MLHAEAVRCFAAPPERVFARYTDHASWTTWAGLGRAEVARPGVPPPNGVGAIRRIGAAPGFVVDEEIVDFEPPRRMTYTLVRGGFPIRDHLGEVLFEPDGSGTRVTWRVRCEPVIPGTGPAIRWFLERLFRRTLANLARDLGA